MTELKPKGETLSIDDIMEHIRGEIKKKQEEGFYTKDEGREFLEHGAAIAREAKGKMEEMLSLINRGWDPTEDRQITSHRPYIGKAIVLSKKLIRLFSRPFFKVMLQGQKDYNRNLAKLATVLINYLNPSMKSMNDNIRDLMSRYEDLGERYLDLIEKHNRLYESHLRTIETFNIQQRKLDAILSGTPRVSSSKFQVSNSKPQTPSLHFDDKSYILFEEKFRGAREEVKEKQRIYTGYFKGVGKVLDLGCGRGEFLELLREEGIDSYGTDTNEMMVSLCGEKGLKAIKEDGVSHLRSLEENSLGGIFAAQIVEHLGAGELIDLVREGYRKLKSSGVFVAETVNPLCLTVFSGPFYLDLTHVKPIHPQALAFLMEMTGFRDVEIRFTSPYPEEMKLQQVDFFHKMRKFEDAFLNIINNNINRLNELLYGYQDYAVIGRK